MGRFIRWGVDVRWWWWRVCAWYEEMVGRVEKTEVCCLEGGQEWCVNGKRWTSFGSGFGVGLWLHVFSGIVRSVLVARAMRRVLYQELRRRVSASIRKRAGS